MALLEASIRGLREELETRKRGVPVEAIRGIARPDGIPPTDEELKENYTRYLHVWPTEIISISDQATLADGANCFATADSGPIAATRIVVASSKDHNYTIHLYKPAGFQITSGLRVYDLRPDWLD